MSGSIGRSYLIQSWNDASSYSGEQIGNRLKESTDLYLANGRANIGLFAEEAPKAKAKKKVPIASKILSQNVTLNRLDSQEKELDEAYRNSEINLDDYEELLYVIEGKRERAHKSLLKALGKDVEDDPVGQHTLTPVNVSESLKTQDNSLFLSTSEGWIEKNVKSDAKIFLLSSLVVFIVGFMVFS